MTARNKVTPVAYENVEIGGVMCIDVTVPAKFWFDHDNRGLVGDEDVVEVFFENARQVKMTLRLSAAQELLDDAKFYSDDQWFDPEFKSLCRSARSTVRVLTEAGVK
jgi:hypothetical protein